MYNNKSLKIISILLFIMVIIFIAYYFIYKDIRYKNENRHIILYDLSFQNDRQDYLISEQKKINDIDLEINLINNSIIPKEGEIEFIENLELIARENGLSMEINSLVFDDNLNLASSSTEILKIKAKTKGSWSGNYEFLARLESLPVKIKINKFGLTNTSSDIISGVSKNSLLNNIWQSTFEIDVLKYK